MGSVEKTNLLELVNEYTTDQDCVYLATRQKKKGVLFWLRVLALEKRQGKQIA